LGFRSGGEVKVRATKKGNIVRGVKHQRQRETDPFLFRKEMGGKERQEKGTVPPGRSKGTKGGRRTA